MKVRVIHTSLSSFPKEWLLCGDSEHSVRHLTMGKKLDVHAVVNFEGQVLYCVINDLEMFSFEYAWLFEIIDRALERDWIINSIPVDSRPIYVIGPEFLAHSIDAYVDFVEQVPAVVSKMWERLDMKRSTGP